MIASGNPHLLQHAPGQPAPTQSDPTQPAPAQHALPVGWLRAGFVALALLAISAELATRGAHPSWRNALADVALAAIVFSAIFLRGRALDLPFPRWRAFAFVLPAAIAVLAAWPTLGLPYLSDDWSYLAILGDGSEPLHILVSPHLFLRPVGWALWWCFAHLAPLDGTLAHATCVALFAIDAALVVPALRRCGAPRGIALAAAVCFAVSPAALGTVAWSSNLFSLLSAGFSLAAIAWLPFRRATAASIARTFALAAFAFLSKEDSYLLPVLLVAVGAQFQARKWRSGLRLAAHGAAALIVILALRSLVFGGIGGYHLESGRPIAVYGWLPGALETARTEFPTSYFQPFLRWGESSRSASLIALIPLALLGLGGASAAARNGMPRGLAITLTALVPTLSILPVGPLLPNVRMLFTPSIGLAWIAASLIAWFPLGRIGRFAALALFVAMSFVVGRRNFTAWEEAGRLFRSGTAAAAPLVAASPPHASLLIQGLPEVTHGAPCFLNAPSFAIPRVAGRRDVHVLAPLRVHADLDRVIEVDAWAGTARDITRAEPEDQLASGNTMLFDFRTSVARDRCRVFGFQANVLEDSWELSSNGDASTVRLPTLGVLSLKQVVIRVDASATLGGHPIARTLFVTYESGKGLARRLVVLGEPVVLPRLARTLRVEIVAPMGTLMRLRELTIEAR